MKTNMIFTAVGVLVGMGIGAAAIAAGGTPYVVTDSFFRDGPTAVYTLIMEPSSGVFTTGCPHDQTMSGKPMHNGYIIKCM